jgi:hypothetical protein
MAGLQCGLDGGLVCGVGGLHPAQIIGQVCGLQIGVDLHCGATAAGDAVLRQAPARSVGIDAQQRTDQPISQCGGLVVVGNGEV